MGRRTPTIITSVRCPLPAPTGDVSLSNEEVAALKQAIEDAQHTSAAAQAAQTALQTVQKAIAANHGAPAAGPYQIETDFSTAISQVPPVAPPPVQVWEKVAAEGDVVLIKAGTTVRYGAPAGTVNQSDGTKLAADAWNPPVTYAKDTTLSVTNDNFGPDPATNYIKELDQLGTAGGVARTTAQ